MSLVLVGAAPAGLSPDLRERFTAGLAAQKAGDWAVAVKEFADPGWAGTLLEDYALLFQAEAQLRQMLTQPGTPYDQLERVAVLAGMAPMGEGSRAVPSGRWSLHPDGYYVLPPLRLHQHGGADLGAAGKPRGGQGVRPGHAYRHAGQHRPPAPDPVRPPLPVVGRGGVGTRSAGPVPRGRRFSVSG